MSNGNGNEIMVLEEPAPPAFVPPVIGTVEVADELGFAYLYGGINFGALGREEIFQNVRFIILTEYFSCPLDREFGLDYSLVDKPMHIAEAILAQEVTMKITFYEPRVQFQSIDFERDELNGKLLPSVKVQLLTTAELPSAIPLETTPAAAPGVVVTEVDLPAFYEALIEMARVPGPPGPVGAGGAAATIEVGETTTGAPGTGAEVANVGNSSAAVFDFIIPKGDKGEQGTGVSIKGTVPNSGALPTTGNEEGDMWIAADTGHGWVWDGDSWVDAGPIQGPVGPQGPQGVPGPTGATGPQGAQGEQGDQGIQGEQGIQGQQGAPGPAGATGPQGAKGDTGATGAQGATGATGAPGPANALSVQSTTTGASGTNANVTISGTSPTQSLAFVIPRGDVGAAGAAGSQGSQGPAGVAATATAGTTTTGAPGSAANVANAGTPSAAVFNFTIPRGDVGAQGPQGIQGIQGPARLPPRHLTMLTLVNDAIDAVNDIVITPGECRDITNSDDMVLSSGLTKRLDAAWAVGTNQGGLDTGTVTNGTYHVFLIKRSDTGVVDALFSGSPTTPTMPANYTYKRRIGSILREAGTIISFFQYGNRFMRDTAFVNWNGTTGRAQAFLAVSVPSGINVWPILQGIQSQATAGSIITSLLAGQGSSAVIQFTRTGPASESSTAITESLISNTSAQIVMSVVIGSGTLAANQVITLGWIDPRDRD